jgi:hypothetical protein
VVTLGRGSRGLTDFHSNFNRFLLSTNFRHIHAGDAVAESLTFIVPTRTSTNRISFHPSSFNLCIDKKQSDVLEPVPMVCGDSCKHLNNHVPFVCHRIFILKSQR